VVRLSAMGIGDILHVYCVGINPFSLLPRGGNKHNKSLVSPVGQWNKDNRLSKHYLYCGPSRAVSESMIPRRHAGNRLRTGVADKRIIISSVEGLSILVYNRFDVLDDPTHYPM
jgi:hypothetical protein